MGLRSWWHPRLDAASRVDWPYLQEALKACSKLIYCDCTRDLQSDISTHTCDSEVCHDILEILHLLDYSFSSVLRVWSSARWNLSFWQYHNGQPRLSSSRCRCKMNLLNSQHLETWTSSFQGLYHSTIPISMMPEISSSTVFLLWRRTDFELIIVSSLDTLILSNTSHAFTGQCIGSLIGAALSVAGSRLEDADCVFKFPHKVTPWYLYVLSLYCLSQIYVCLIGYITELSFILSTDTRALHEIPVMWNGHVMAQVMAIAVAALQDDPHFYFWEIRPLPSSGCNRFRIEKSVSMLVVARSHFHSNWSEQLDAWLTFLPCNF